MNQIDFKFQTLCRAAELLVLHDIYICAPAWEADFGVWEAYSSQIAIMEANI